MINLKSDSEIFLQKNVKHVYEALKQGNYDNALNLLDDFITESGFNSNWELTDMGRIAQRIYDEIHYNIPE